MLSVGAVHARRAWALPSRMVGFTDVVRRYLAPPENAIVLCVDEKCQIQALDRTAPMLPVRTVSIEKHLPHRWAQTWRWIQCHLSVSSTKAAAAWMTCLNCPWRIAR